MSGYFAKSDNGCYIQALPGVTSTTKKPSLQKGWNLFGVGLKDLTINDNVFSDCRSKITGPFFMFDNSDYNQVSNLQVGRGYWVRLTDVCTLQVANIKNGGGSGNNIQSSAVGTSGIIKSTSAVKDLSVRETTS
ncbi:Uncharacterised protein [uncultured archaeon]|nr:Uncharacterised protein [uncultured archaeon]